MIDSRTETLKTDAMAVLFGLSFIIFAWFALALALGGLFLFPLIASGATLSGILAIITGWKLLARAPLDYTMAFFVILLFAVCVGFFAEPTLFSGRDQGSISEAAFRLANNGQLAFATEASRSFFQIYGAGTALNFPGFAYTKDGSLITQFPIGYTAWLGSFISLFGIEGVVIANAFLFFLFLFTLYCLLRLFLHPYYAFSGLALALFSFLTTWFAKITVSENLAVFLFTFLAYNLILFFREGKFIAYAGVLLSAGLLAFTRIEGFAFLILSLFLLLWNQHARHIWKMYPWKSVVFPGIVFLYLFLRDFFINLPYYKVIGKATLKFIHQLGSGNITGDLANTGGAFPLGSVFFVYGLLFIFCLGFFGILLIIKEKQYLLLLPTLLALPTFIYLVDPNISLDHPWMLRRYLFSIFPALLFSAIIGIALLCAKEKNFPLARPQGKRLMMASIIFAGLIILQYPAWSLGIPFAENRTLLNQVATFSQEFSNQDLILVDRNVTGDGFALLTGPAQYLYNRNAVYFFNPADLADLNLSPYERVYLIVPEGDQARYVSVFGERLVLKKTIIFSLEQFENLSLEDFVPRLPTKTSKETKNLVFQIY